MKKYLPMKMSIPAAAEKPNEYLPGFFRFSLMANDTDAYGFTGERGKSEPFTPSTSHVRDSLRNSRSLRSDNQRVRRISRPGECANVGVLKSTLPSGVEIADEKPGMYLMARKLGLLSSRGRCCCTTTVGAATGTGAYTTGGGE